GAAGTSRPSLPARAQETAAQTVREFDPADTRDWRTSLRDAGVIVDAPTVAAAPPIEAPAQTESPAITPTDDMAFKKGIVVAPDAADPIPDAILKLRSLDEIAQKVKKCTRCPLYETATNAVPGEGDPHAQLVCVGEAPGAKEDETGRPFVGQAGQLLTKILAAIDMTREQVFICNVLKHRPPGNRNPRPEEVEACSPYLIRQLELIKPKVIVAFGTFAAQTLLQTKTPLGQLRGLVHRYHGTPLVVTYHPAALLRNPAWKRPTWEDVKLARRILDSASRS
ncbi:MAG TPA: uracil-DNA glycosylase, partial [Gemmatimonadaceae bacterium]|nr:uracil-DNA glycosylase [Gemmatimonadaceae bacterium]